jgi:hypothetical protein
MKNFASGDEECAYYKHVFGCVDWYCCEYDADRVNRERVDTILSIMNRTAVECILECGPGPNPPVLQPLPPSPLFSNTAASPVQSVVLLAAALATTVCYVSG